MDLVMKRHFQDCCSIVIFKIENAKVSYNTFAYFHLRETYPSSISRSMKSCLGQSDPQFLYLHNRSPQQ